MLLRTSERHRQMSADHDKMIRQIHQRRKFYPLWVSAIVAVDLGVLAVLSYIGYRV